MMKLPSLSPPIMFFALKPVLSDYKTTAFFWLLLVFHSFTFHWLGLYIWSSLLIGMISVSCCLCYLKISTFSLIYWDCLHLMWLLVSSELNLSLAIYFSIVSYCFLFPPFCLFLDYFFMILVSFLCGFMLVFVLGFIVYIFKLIQSPFKWYYTT